VNKIFSFIFLLFFLYISCIYAEQSEVVDSFQNIELLNTEITSEEKIDEIFNQLESNEKIIDVIQEDKKVAEAVHNKEERVRNEDETFGVPVPVMGTSPNSGVMYGVLFAVVTETNGYIDNILAPLAVYNDLTGYNVDINYFGFPSENISYQLYFSHSSENFWEYSILYKHKNFLDPSLIFNAYGKWARESANRFYGMGPKSKEDDETCYTERNIEFELNLTWEVYKHFFLTGSWKGRANWLRKGIVDDIDTLKDHFADIEGIDGSYAMPLSFGLMYDSRDDDVSPTQGIYSRLYVEGAHKSLLSSFSYAKIGVDASIYIPKDEDKRFITVAHVLFEYMTGKDIPFYEHSMLGGSKTLRGFGDGRFYDNHRLLLNIEERIRLFRFVIAGILVDIESAIWCETGQVFGAFREIRTKDFRTVVGIGARFVVRSQIVAKVDIGFGEEGHAIFAGLDYPF